MFYVPPPFSIKAFPSLFSIDSSSPVSHLSLKSPPLFKFPSLTIFLFLNVLSFI